MSLTFDAIILGAGAAGLFCAAQAGQRGLKVLLIDHADRVAEKIRISGGGRCNFTNRDLDVRAPHKHFVGQNPQFCRSALSRYTPQDFIALLHKHSIERVLVVDYKTNRPAPDRLEDVDPAYLTQLAVYAAVLRQLYPDRPVEAALVWTDGPKLMPVTNDVLMASLG